MTDVSFADLVAATTVGVSRRPVHIVGLDGPAGAHANALDRDDPAAAVLDAAALLVAARRAGRLPILGMSCPAPADPETAPEWPARASDALEKIRPADPILLADLLAAAADSGYRAPAPLLPSLLDAAVKYAPVLPAVAAVLGARGRWLATHRSDWQHAVNAVAPGVPDDPAVWETGNRNERHAYLAMLRDRDQTAARDLLAAGWAKETGGDRADLLAVLACGLSAADEEFLEQALDDQMAPVRAAAQALLARLPGSAFNRRAAQRAAPLLRVEPSGLRRRLAASLPRGVDGSAFRDGIVTSPPTPAIGARAWLLTQLVAAAPLTEWVTRFGLDARQIVSLPVTGDLAMEVQGGWRLAAIRQASMTWAEALLAAGEHADAGQRPPAAWPPDHQLAAVLPPAAQAARATALLTMPTVTTAAIAAATDCPGPWTAALGKAVFAILELAFTTGDWTGSPKALLLAAARNLPVNGSSDYADALTQLASVASCPQPWPTALRHAANTVALRRAFLKEIR